MKPPKARFLLLAALAPLAQAQTTPRLPKPHGDEKQPAATATSLPVTRVSLYKNGVGYFEHDGHVTGDGSVTIDFTTAQLNDVLQSLTAIDLNGGRIAGAGYNSTTPLDQQLKSLPLELDANPSAADFYAAIRGARVELHAPGVSLIGRLLSVESRDVALPGGAENNGNAAVSKQFLTVVGDSGEVRTVELTAATSLRLLDAELHGDVSRYLQLLASNRSQGLRHLTLSDRGTGTRQLHVSYISEVPVWKSTYRILFTDSAAASGKQPATLQGWAVVDNTVGSDWNNVQLTLVAGAPQSFIQPLSDPIYSRRPEIPIAQEAQMSPQTFESGNDTRAEASALAPAPPPPPFPKMMARSRTSAGVAGMSGMAAGATGGVIAGLAGGSGSGPAYTSANQTVEVSSDDFEAKAVNSLTPNTTTAAFDDFFQYKLSEPVTIHKNESALVPILQARVEAERVTLATVNGAVASQPLRALWLHNSSGLTLDRGSFSIVENGSFGGEGLLDPIHPDERRLLSYAADQAVHISTDQTHPMGDNHITRLAVSKGVLKITRSVQVSATYIVHNAAPDRRTVILEQPISRGFKLDDGIKPEETTSTANRFRLEIPPNATERLPLSAHRTISSSYSLASDNDSQLTYVLNQSQNDPKLIAALQPVVGARRRVADAQIAVNETNQRLNALKANEERQRANIAALAKADKATTDRFVHDLNSTEDQINGAQTELNNRTAVLDAAKAELTRLIETLEFDEAL